MSTLKTASMKSQEDRVPQALERLLVATDFSEHATEALRSAIELARAHDAEILLVHAVDSELPTLAAPDDPLGRFIRQNLGALESLVRGSGVPVCAEIHLGKPWDVITKVARESTVDLIILGAQGKSRVSERFLGTTADRVIKTSSVPVLVAPKRPLSSAHDVQTILVATDFSEEAALATSMAVRLLHGCVTEGHLVLLHSVALSVKHIDADVPMPIPEYWDAAERDAAQKLQTLAASLRNDRMTVEAKTFRGYPAETILSEARNCQADLIAMGTQGRKGLDRFFMGSVAERVLHHADCPVLTVRRPEGDQPIQLSAD